MQRIKNLFYPKLKCPVCFSFSEDICIPCNLNFKRINNMSINKENKKGISIYQNEGSAKRLISNFKTKGSYNSLDAISCKIIDNSLDFFEKFDYISYLPSSKNSIKKLGFDHGYELGRSISKKSSIPLVKKLFKSSGKASFSFDLEKRGKKIKTIILNPKINISPYKDKNILILDYLYTSGSTLNGCIDLLKKEGIKGSYLTFVKDIKN